MDFKPEPNVKKTVSGTFNVLLCNLRLLEAAGAAELCAVESNENEVLDRPQTWWTDLAGFLRTYRSVLRQPDNTPEKVLYELERTPGQLRSPDLIEAVDDLRAELLQWQSSAGAAAYLAWISAWTGMVELDGRWANLELSRALRLVSQGSNSALIDVALVSFLNGDGNSDPRATETFSTYSAIAEVAEILSKVYMLELNPISTVKTLGYVPGIFH